MPIEKSAGAVIFRKEEGIVKYLLLHYPSGSPTQKAYWDFSKGHIEGKERPEETARREVEEETGLKDLKFSGGFKKWIKYFFKFEGKTIFKIVTFYLAETKTKEIKISGEHIGYQWFSYEKAIEQLTFKNSQEILRKANKFLAEIIKSKKLKTPYHCHGNSKKYIISKVI